MLLRLTEAHSCSLLITDAANSLYSHPPRKERDKLLIDTIVATMRSEGSVLLPCDTAGRVFELALLLDDYWQHTVRFRVQLVYLHIACMVTFVR